MHIIFLGDIVGKPGRKTVKKILPELREYYNADLVIANGENAAGGRGITPAVLSELLTLNIDVITTGNHIWDRKEIMSIINEQARLLRPANMSPHSPGKGVAIVPCGDHLIGIMNLVGRIFMSPADCPFQVAIREIDLLQKITPTIILDFHAEATSEKLAMLWFLKDKVSAIIGTHTHVQTADERICGKTAYISDVGMVGPYNSVLGLEPESVLEKFLKGMPSDWRLATGECILNGIYLQIDPSNGKTLQIERIVKRYNI